MFHISRWKAPTIASIITLSVLALSVALAVPSLGGCQDHPGEPQLIAECKSSIDCIRKAREGGSSWPFVRCRMPRNRRSAPHPYVQSLAAGVPSLLP